MMVTAPVGTSRAEEVLAQYQAVAEKMAPAVAAFLGLPALTNIRVMFGNVQGNLAYSGPPQPNDVSLIYVNPGVRAEDPRAPYHVNPAGIVALMAHELTHATIGAAAKYGSERRTFQYGDEGTVPWAFQEGLAQWVAHTVTPKDPLRLPGGAFDWGILQQHTKPLHTGYDAMSGYLQWVAEQHPGVPQLIAHQLAHGTFSPATFEKATGTSIHDSVQRFRDTVASQPYEPPAPSAPAAVYNPTHQQI